MKNSKFLILILTIQCLIPRTYAQVVNWKELFRIQSENNRELNIEKENLKIAILAEQTAQAGYLPSIDISLSSNQSFSALTDFERNEKSAASLNLNQNLFNGFYDLAKVKQAEINSRIAEAKLSSVKVNIYYELNLALINYWYLIESKKLIDKIVARRKENLKIVELRYQSGRENKGSFLISEAYFLQAQFEKKQIDLQIFEIKKNIHFLIGDENHFDDIDYTNYELVIKNKIHALNNITSRSELSLDQINKIIVLNPDYKMNFIKQELGDRLIQEMESKYYPQLNLTGSIGKVDSHFFPEKDNWSIGLKLIYPLYSGGKDQSQLKVASLQKNQNKFSLDSIALNLKFQIQKKFSEAILASLKVNIDNSFKSAIAMRSEIARNKYNNGLTTFDDWDQVENDLISREKSFLTSKKNEMGTIAEWEKILGVGSYDQEK